MNVAAQIQIPPLLMRDRYWGSLLHIFMNNAKLKQYLKAPYVDTQGCEVASKELQRLAKPWSDSERFMLQLALHLFNETHKVNLSDMDCLDSINREIALKAIQIRFHRG